MTALAARAMNLYFGDIHREDGPPRSFPSSLRSLIPTFLLPSPELLHLIHDPQGFTDALRKHTYSDAALKVAFCRSLCDEKIENVKTMETLGLVPSSLSLSLITRMIVRINNDERIEQVLAEIGHRYEADQDSFDDLVGALLAKRRYLPASECIYRGATPRVESAHGSPWIDRQMSALCQALRSKSYMNELDLLCGKGGQKIQKSDAFNREAPYNRSNFISVALYAMYLSQMLGGQKVAQEIFTSLISADISRIENTKGLSWKKYRQLEKLHLGRIDTFIDVIQEVNNSLVTPIVLMHGYDQCLLKGEIDTHGIAGRLLAQGKSSLDFAGINQSWHRAGNGLPATCRPLHARFDSWSPLFEGEVQLGHNFSIMALSSKRQLQEEGAALDHCVGVSSYPQSCFMGSCQILALRFQGTPCATIELGRGPATTGRVQLIDTELHQWSVVQFRGARNTMPTKVAHQALERFASLVKHTHVKLCVVPQQTTLDMTFAQRIGFRLKDAPEWLPQVLNHYNTRVRLVKNDGSVVPLIQETNLEKLTKQILRGLPPPS
jgi:hypothetical protein